MEVLRRHTDYALRVALYLAEHYGKRYVPVREITGQMAIPYPIACKLLQKLCRAKIAESSLGLRGGYQLTQSPKVVTVLDIIQAVQGPIRLNKCIKAKKPCTRQSKCPIHGFLEEVQSALDRRMASTTLWKLVQKNS